MKPSANPPLSSAPKTRILIVDDDEGLLSVMKSAFERMNCEVLLATNGAEALEIVKREELTVVISDVRMPKMNGVQLLEAINALNLDLPVIIMSGHSDYSEDDIDERDGVVLLEKVFSVQALKAIVEEYISLLPKRTKKNPAA